MRVKLLILIVSLLSFHCVLAETDAELEAKLAKFDRFELWTGCQPIGTGLRNLPIRVLPDGVDKKVFRDNVEFKLKRAKLLHENADWVIAPAIDITHDGEYVEIEFIKSVTDIMSGEKSWVTTWSRSTSFDWENSYSFYDAVDSLVDKFLSEFLRVNMDACAKRNTSS